MEIDRRTFVAGLSALLTAPEAALAVPVAATETSSRQLFAAARRDQQGRFVAAILSAEGREIRNVELPARGHDATFCPISRRCVMFARRPGNFAVVLSAEPREPPHFFTTPDDRHFYGHGAFSPDGRLLYTTENDFEAGRGVIGIYDATFKFRRVGEFSSFGVGPHDIALLRHSPVLAIANGGLREHPDIGGGRRILNSTTVTTSLAYVDLNTGDLLELHQLPQNAPISLRHFDCAPDDTIVIGAQALHKGDRDSPLVFRHRRQSDLATISLAASARSSLAGYVSSIAVDREGRTAAVTSSKGGRILLLDIGSGAVLQSMSVQDVSGVASEQKGKVFRITTGVGTVLSVSTTAPLTVLSKGQSAWDNHLAAS